MARIMHRTLIITLTLLVFVAFARAQEAKPLDGGWPAGKSPTEIGTIVAQRFVDSPHQNFGRTGKPDRITYPEVCAWYGALTFAKVTSNVELRQQLVQRFEPLFGVEKKYVP